MIDYSELLIATRAASLKLEKALRAEKWDVAREIQLDQCQDEADLLLWIGSKVKQ